MFGLGAAALNCSPFQDNKSCFYHSVSPWMTQFSPWLRYACGPYLSCNGLGGTERSLSKIFLILWFWLICKQWVNDIRLLWSYFSSEESCWLLKASAWTHPTQTRCPVEFSCNHKDVLFTVSHWTTPWSSPCPQALTVFDASCSFKTLAKSESNPNPSIPDKGQNVGLRQ